MAEKVKAAFVKYDADKNGSVTVDEARQVFLGEMGFNEDQAARLCAIYDRDGDGKLNYEEFADFFERIKHNVTEMNDMFARVDQDHSGTVNFAEIKEALASFGFTDAQIADVIRLHDVNKDGCLQKEEFAHFWLAQI